MPDDKTKQPATLTVSDLAKLIGVTREHASRRYKGWGLKPVAWSSSPRFLLSDVERILLTSPTEWPTTPRKPGQPATLSKHAPARIADIAAKLEQAALTNLLRYEGDN